MKVLSKLSHILNHSIKTTGAPQLTLGLHPDKPIIS